MRIALAALVLTLGITAVANAASATTYWTESRADQMVIQKARIACRWVREPAGCNVRAAAAELAKQKARVTAPAYETNVAWATRELEQIRDGFAVTKSDCTGGGKSDTGGFRFSQFRCKIVVKDAPYYAGSAEYLSGRIVVYVTGPRTFRWAVIS